MTDKVTVDSKGLVKVNGIPVCQKQERNGETMLYFKRKNNCNQRQINGAGECVSLSEFVSSIREND